LILLKNGHIIPKMNNNDRKRRQIKRILRPLVKILMRNQVSITEFIELIKDVFVDVADEVFFLPNKKNTVSRVSLLTGLSRKEVLRIKTQMNSREHTETHRPTKAAAVITGWLKDSDFIDEKNNARDLPIKGNHSFDTLVKRYGGDVTTRAVLDELVANKAVIKNVDSGLVSLISLGFIPKENIERLDIMSKCARDFFETSSFNLEHQGYESHFQRQLTYGELPLSLVKEFKEFSKEKSLEHIFELNRWLADHKKALSADDTKDQTLYRTGLGIYYIQNEE